MAGLRAGADLHTVQAFLNTVDVGEGVDVLSGPDGLRAWLADHDEAAAGAPIGEHDLATARALRHALRELARGNHDGVVDADAAATLNDLAAAVGLTVRFTVAGEVELVGVAPGARGALARLVAAVATAVADGSWQRVKLCSNDACGWVFYDRSRNRSGRWCDMAVCGNRMKARTFRERHR